MSGSGLQEVIDKVYAAKSTVHIMSRKAVSRAVRAHNIVDAALHVLLMEDIFTDNTSCESSDHLSSGEVENLRLVYEGLMAGQFHADRASSDSTVEKLVDLLHEVKSRLVKSRTATLWIQYSELVNLMRVFIRAERTGHWQLHLQVLAKMLPFFAASGHNNYTKRIYLYLQKMSVLEMSHPSVFASFNKGQHVIRRSDRFWAGLSADLVIEQELMRSLKTAGGLTKGRRMSEAQCSVWIMSRPMCLQVNVLILVNTLDVT